MNTWLQGLQVALVGGLVVLAALMLLFSLFILRKSLNKGHPVHKSASEALETLPAQPLMNSDGLVFEEDNQAIAAAITASVYCLLAAEQEAPRGFIVRRIRRIA